MPAAMIDKITIFSGLDLNRLQELMYIDNLNYLKLDNNTQGAARHVSAGTSVYDITETGFYFCENWADKPDPADETALLFHTVDPIYGTYAVQIYFDVNNNDMYIHSNMNGEWYMWSKIDKTDQAS